IVDNGFWDLRISQRTEEGYFTLAARIADKIMGGRFNAKIEAEFLIVLDYYGNDPIIVRSSSILEDGFGNAFAGKYESVFSGNTGTLEERLQKFEEAVRTVYASTMSLAALDYRKRRNLHRRDEQMAILVQRVSGSRYTDFFMPCAAGVGYSASPYRLGTQKPKEGMLRLVMGLGTAAVDRRTGSYPRLVSLDSPSRFISSGSGDRLEYSQQIVDAVSSETNDVKGFDSAELVSQIPSFLKKLMYTHDYQTENFFLERGLRREVLYISCDGLTKNRSLMQDMKDILNLLQEHYEYPVDTEYTINFASDGSYVIDLLQCRPLQLSGEGDRVEVPEKTSKEDVLLETKGVSMGFSREIDIDCVVMIDPVAYYKMPYKRLYEIKNALAEVNWHYRGKGKHLLLLTPGRICTSSPELGVPSAFDDISEFSVIAELSESKAGYIPELSYGSHIFQDLVESGILYTAVFEKESTICFCPQMLAQYPETTGQITHMPDEIRGILRVYDTEGKNLRLYYDMKEEHLLVYG
ncbi:MAG: hypothetical protein IKG55_04750, partial [Solobacterium sp.]|nr:hypothetical protein [Solobacterium sp.]